MTPPPSSIKAARDSIYQREIMSLAKSQLGAGEIADADRRAHLHNPLCGDEIIVTAKLSAAEILDIAHKTRGCVLCLAAAAKMTSLAREIRSINQLIALANQIDLMIGGGGGIVDEVEMFSPVIPHTSRRECALLPFRALKEICGD